MIYINIFYLVMCFIALLSNLIKYADIRICFKVSTFLSTLFMMYVTGDYTAINFLGAFIWAMCCVLDYLIMELEC